MERRRPACSEREARRALRMRRELREFHVNYRGGEPVNIFFALSRSCAGGPPALHRAACAPSGFYSSASGSFSAPDVKSGRTRSISSTVV